MGTVHSLEEQLGASLAIPYATMAADAGLTAAQLDQACVALARLSINELDVLVRAKFEAHVRRTNRATRRGKRSTRT